jgi:hypothetical protein
VGEVVSCKEGCIGAVQQRYAPLGVSRREEDLGVVAQRPGALSFELLLGRAAEGRERDVSSDFENEWLNMTIIGEKRSGCS